MIKLIAIDPGASNGGIAMMDSSGEISTRPIPKDLRKFYEFYGYLLDHKAEPITALEYIGIMPDDLTIPGKIYRIKVLIEHYAKLQGYMDALGFEYKIVHPRSWQAFHSLTKKPEGETETEKKGRYRDWAKVLYPEIKVTTTNQDALLLLDYLYRKLLAGQDIGVKERGIKKKQENSPSLFG